MPEVPAYLAVLSGAPARVVRLTVGEFIAGRVPGTAILLPNMEISRRHCRFIWNGETCIVEDLGSVRGTRVNGQKISVQTQLSAGDKVELGPVTIQFGRGEPPGSLESSTAGEGPSLILVQGKPADRIPATGDLTIGRDSSADVVLNDPSISRRHAQVQALPGGGCVVRDLNSLAGSFVNGHRFDSHELTVGDRLQVGPFCFQYDGSALVRLTASRGSSVHARALVQKVGARVLLDEIAFSIPASHFAGILGSSGAGKSTLLNSLAGLDEADSGQVYIDGDDIYATREPVSFGYVPQDDIVHRELTVLQALRYSARLRLPRSTPPGEIERLLQQTMEQLGLSHCAELSIARLSGGQRKRVSVGVELLVRPAILFLDEPSSGLDPATEFQLMELLRDLADSGCTIVCTTHVIENAYLMDQLLVLTGGCLAFQGTAQEAREYFGVSKLIALYERLLEHPPNEWKARFLQKRPPLVATPAEAEGRRPARGSVPTRPRRRLALPILLQRQAAIFAADWRNFLLVLGEPLIVAALVAWVAAGEQELALFFAYVGVLWFGCSNAAQEIVKEKPVYRREKLVGVGTHSYLLSKFLFQFGVTSIQALLLYVTLSLGFQHLDGSAPWQILSVLGAGFAAVGIGSAISALARTIMQAVLVVPLILIPQILFCGYTLPASRMSDGVYLVARVMPSFASEKLMETSLFWDQPLAGDLLSDHLPALKNLQRAAPAHLNQFYTEPRPALEALGILFLWAFLSYIVAWLALRRSERRR